MSPLPSSTLRLGNAISTGHCSISPLLSESNFTVVTFEVARSLDAGLSNVSSKIAVSCPTTSMEVAASMIRGGIAARSGKPRA